MNGQGSHQTWDSRNFPLFPAIPAAIQKILRRCYNFIIIPESGDLAKVEYYSTCSSGVEVYEMILNLLTLSIITSKINKCGSVKKL